MDVAMTGPARIKSVQDAIAAEIASLESQEKAARADMDNRDQTELGRGDLAFRAGAPATSVGLNPREIVYALEERVHRLKQISSWIENDSQFAKFIDNYIGQRVAASEKRQIRFNLALNVALLIAGWILGLVASQQNMLKMLSMIIGGLHFGH
jgi:hypothetical protein